MGCDRSSVEGKAPAGVPSRGGWLRPALAGKQGARRRLPVVKDGGTGPCEREYGAPVTTSAREADLDVVRQTGRGGGGRAWEAAEVARARERRAEGRPGLDGFGSPQVEILEGALLSSREEPGQSGIVSQLGLEAAARRTSRRASQ